VGGGGGVCVRRCMCWHYVSLNLRGFFPNALRGTRPIHPVPETSLPEGHTDSHVLGHLVPLWQGLGNAYPLFLCEVQSVAVYTPGWQAGGEFDKSRGSL
jgi:hypothetical protein